MVILKYNAEKKGKVISIIKKKGIKSLKTLGTHSEMDNKFIFKTPKYMFTNDN